MRGCAPGPKSVITSWVTNRPVRLNTLIFHPSFSSSRSRCRWLRLTRRSATGPSRFSNLHADHRDHLPTRRRVALPWSIHENLDGLFRNVPGQEVAGVELPHPVWKSLVVVAGHGEGPYPKARPRAGGQGFFLGLLVPGRGPTPPALPPAPLGCGVGGPLFPYPY